MDGCNGSNQYSSHIFGTSVLALPHARLWGAKEHSCVSQPSAPISSQSVQSLSHIWLFVTPWTAACQASLSFTNSQSLLKLMSIESVTPSNNLILCCPLLLLSSIIPSIRVFSNESVLHIRWPKYWSFRFSINLSNEYSGLISFGLTGLISLLSKGLSSSTPQFKNIILRRSAFFIVQLSHSYMTTEKIIAWTPCTFVGKVMSLLFNMLSRLVMVFLPRSKHLLISWLHSPSAVGLELKKIKSVSVSIVPPSIFHEMMGPDASILVFWMLSFKPAFSFSSFTRCRQTYTLTTIFPKQVTFLKMLCTLKTGCKWLEFSLLLP